MRIPRDLPERVFVVAALILFSGAVMPMLRLGAGTGAQALEGDPVQQMVWLGLYAVTAGLILLRIDRVLRVAAANWSLWALILLVVVSAAWADYPSVTLRKTFALLGTTAFALYFVARFGVEEQVRLLGWVFGLLGVMSIGAVVYVPELAIDQRWTVGAWQGVFIQKNALGRAMVVGVVVFLVLAGSVPRRRRWVPLCGLALCAVLIVLSTSKTALLLAAALVVLYGVVSARRRIRSTLLVPAAIALVLLGAGGALALAFHAEAAASALGRDVTLTGRTVLWSMVLEYIAQRPLLGHGYGSFWLGARGASGVIQRVLGWQVPHSHNGLLDLALDLGMAGVALFLWSYFLGLRRSYALAVRGTGASARWPLMMLLITALYNMTESTLLSRNSIYWVLFVAALAWAAHARRNPAAAFGRPRGRGPGEGSAPRPPARRRHPVALGAGAAAAAPVHGGGAGAR